MTVTQIVKNEGEFRKRIDKSLKQFNDYFHIDTCDLLPSDLIRGMIEDAKKDIIEIGTLETIRDYILKYAEKLPDGTPIFSAREFAKKLDEHREKLQKWFGS